jgi:hypothetical protein
MARKRRWTGTLFRFLLYAIAVSLAVTFFSTDHFNAFGGAPDALTLSRMKLSNQFKGHKFKNDEPDFLPDRKLFVDTLDDYFFGKQLRAPGCALPLFPNTAELIKAAPGTGLRITWLGHSTTLIQLDGAAILTDPIWSERASPFTWVGPKRFHPPPLALDALPKIDAVIISHDHYDHLDMETVRALAARGVPFHVPLGIGAHLAKWGVPANQIFEHDWWESADIKLLSGDIHLERRSGYRTEWRWRGASRSRSDDDSYRCVWRGGATLEVRRPSTPSRREVTCSML